jgi:hypothetical protein
MGRVMAGAIKFWYTALIKARERAAGTDLL